MPARTHGERGDARRKSPNSQGATTATPIIFLLGYFTIRSTSNGVDYKNFLVRRRRRPAFDGFIISNCRTPEAPRRKFCCRQLKGRRSTFIRPLRRRQRTDKRALPSDLTNTFRGLRLLRVGSPGNHPGPAGRDRL